MMVMVSHICLLASLRGPVAKPAAACWIPFSDEESWKSTGILMKPGSQLEVIACCFILRLKRKAVFRRYMQLKPFLSAGSRCQTVTGSAFADYAMTTVQNMGSAQRTFTVLISNYTNIDKAE